MCVCVCVLSAPYSQADTNAVTINPFPCTYHTDFQPFVAGAQAALLDYPIAWQGRGDGMISYVDVAVPRLDSTLYPDDFCGLVHVRVR